MNAWIRPQESLSPCKAEDLPIDVGIRAVGDGEGAMRSFLASTPAMPDESLIGWLARVGALNAHRSLSKSLRKVGIDTACPSAVATSRTDDARQVAFLLKADPSEVAARTYPPTTQAGAPMVEFFGVPIRTNYLTGKTRRVSPRALRLSGHHRAVWSVRPLPFDPETMETLIRACPVCGGILGWRRTAGICFCERCIDGKHRPRVDLRDFPQPLVEVADMDALHFVASLVDPARREPCTPAGVRTPVDGSLTRGEMFDLAILLAGALENGAADRGAGYARRFGACGETSGLSPTSLARAGRAIVNWPAGLFEIADEILDSNRVEAIPLGGLGDIPLFEFLRRSLVGQPRLLALFDDAIVAYLARVDGDKLVARRRKSRANRGITMGQTMIGLNVNRPALVRLAASGKVQVVRHKRIAVFDGDEIAPILAERGQVVDRLDVASRLGVPLGVLPDLVAKGIIHRAEGPVLILLRDPEQYRLAPFNAFLAQLGAAVHGEAKETDLRLPLAVSRLSVGPKPWGAIIEAIKEGRLRVRCFETAKPGALARMAVDPVELVAVVDDAPAPIGADPEGRTNYAEASDYFGVQEAVFGKLTGAGLLPAHSLINLRLRRGDLDVFAKRYVFSEEIARRLNTTKQEAARTLRDGGLEPIAGPLPSKTFLWVRMEVERFLRMRATPVARSVPWSSGAGPVEHQSQ
jgi:hypothetical protein